MLKWNSKKGPCYELFRRKAGNVVCIGEHACHHFQKELRKEHSAKNIIRCNLWPVVQSIVSLTMSSKHQLVLFKYMSTTLSNALLFFVGKM